MQVFCGSIGLWIFILSQAGGTDAQVYEWSCSALNIAYNYHTLPDLSGIEGFISPSSLNEISIYPLPPVLNCSGTVSGVGYCYRAFTYQLESEQLVFTLLILEQNGLNLTVTNIIRIPTVQRCYRYSCCDFFTLDLEDQFHLPAPNFAFGIIVTEISLLAFHSSSVRVEHHRLSTEELGSLTVGDTISVDSTTSDRTLRLFRFFIIPTSGQPTSEMIPSITTNNPTTATTPNVVRTRGISTTSSPPTMAGVASTAGATDTPTTAGVASTAGATDTPTTAGIATTAGSGGTTPTTSTNPEGDGTTEEDGDARTSGDLFTSEEPSAVGGLDNGDGGSIVGAAVGGVVGVGVAVALLVVIVVCVVAVVLKRRNKFYSKLDQGGGISYPNAVYGSDEQYETVRSDYIGIEPHSYSDIGEAIGEAAAADRPNFYEQISGSQSHEYSYAESNIRAELIDETYEAVTQLSVREQSMEHPESIYQKPGEDENTLYAQLNEIRTDNITRDSILLGDFLGSGQFGTVYKGVWLSCIRGEVKVAVKTLKEGSGEEDRVKFLQEATLMGQFKHPNVVEMCGVVTQGEPILLVLELLVKGDLRCHLSNMKSDEAGGVSVDDHTLLRYCRQVASGMAYLSSKAFVHRDLAARNILVSDADICKIADFGMSRDLMDENYYVSHGGKIPVKWTAPEALHYKKFSTASDVWSYGALMYEIWSVGQKPYGNLANKGVLELVDTGYRLPPPPGCPRALYTIMMSCWHPETPKRPCFIDISHQLSLPDGELLKWTEEDKSTHPEVDKLGADLLYAQDLYKDLQLLYKQNRT